MKRFTPMRIIDSHQHLWDPAARAYAWMDDSVKPIRRRFDVDDLRRAAPPVVVHTVAVQAVNALDETEELLRIAEDSELVAGVVGWVDLRKPDVAETLARLIEGPGGRSLVGIRHLVHDEDDPQWLSRSDVVRGLEAVASARLTYDLLVRTRELPAAIDVVRRIPELDFVLDHAAKPEIAAARWDPWAERIAELAAYPNVACKISGLVTEADHRIWQQSEILPYVRRVIELFTPRRLLFGSDWPVCLLAASYDRVMQLASAAFAELNSSDRDAVFYGNARRLYLQRPP